MKAKKVIFYNQKGGVGKTTAAVNLGSALSELGQKVLLIDFDAQCNLTGAVSGDLRKPNIYQVIVGRIPAASAVQSTIFNNLYVIPGSIDVAGLSIELVNENNREFYLRTVLEPLDDDFDFIILDCPPSLGLETMNALAIAFFELKEYENAKNLASKLLEQFPDNVNVLLLLAKSYIELGDAQNSVQYLEKIMKIFPDQPEAKSLYERIKGVNECTN